MDCQDWRRSTPQAFRPSAEKIQRNANYSIRARTNAIGRFQDNVKHLFKTASVKIQKNRPIQRFKDCTNELKTWIVSLYSKIVAENGCSYKTNVNETKMMFESDLSHHG